MRLSLWIAPESQYGALRLQDGRRGARRRALVEGIKRHLFGLPDGPEFAAILQSFGAAASGLEFKQPLTLRIWAALTVPRDDGDTPDPQPDELVPVPPKQDFDTVFCIAVHGLCQAFAVQHLQAESDDAEDEEGGEGNEGAETDAAPREADAAADVDMDAGLWTREALARGIVAALLVKSLPRALREADEEDLRTGTRLIADALLGLLVSALSAWFERRQDKAGQPYRIVVRVPELRQRVDSVLADLPFFYTPQPLKDPVAYRPDDPGPADTDGRDYFCVDLIGYRRTNPFLRHVHDLRGKPDRVAPEFQGYLDAVNAQQAVAWRINLPLLDLAERLVRIASDPEVRAAEARQAGLTATATAELLAWIVKRFYQPEDTRVRRKYLRPGEILDHPLMQSGLEELRTLGADDTQPRFFLPWKADYRGRIYAETPWLTPQGGDLQRALFEFADGSPLDGTGVSALRRHGANLVQRARVLNDLGISGRQVVTLEERERWVRGHAADILASAASPIAAAFWREVTDKPMQFLAFCLAYRQWTLAPDAPVHLPVQIDGTCNGLQHIAMLTGDPDLARAVNVLPREDRVPGDVYSEIAAAARKTLGHIGSLLSPETRHAEGLELADAWLAETPATWLHRGTAKKVIMTVPYGARENSQAEQVAEAIAGRVEQMLRDHPDLPQVEALCAWVVADPARGKGLYPLTKGQFKTLRKAANGSETAARQARQTWERLEAGNPIPTERVVELQIKQELHLLEAEKAKQALQPLEIVTAYAARVIVKHLRHALATTYPCVDRFSDWLRQKANACAFRCVDESLQKEEWVGLPLLWPTPLGFPVCQDKFKLEGGSATAKLGGRQTIRVDVQRLGNRVEAHKQRDALLPNLIHSLDATHLALVLNASRRYAPHGVGSIHDCLLCHPNDAAGLSLAVRRTFARLYRTTRADGIPAVLADWSDWMDGMARLLSLQNPQTVLGAIDHPEGVGATLLAAQARGDGETGAAARNALALIESLRRLSPSRQWLMRSLIEFMGQESETDRAARIAAAGRVGTAAGLAITSGIPLGDGAGMSDYFFS